MSTGALLPCAHFFVMVVHVSPRSSRWCFTIPNWTAEDVARLDAVEVTYMVYGREVAPTTGMRHLQGFVIFPHARRLTGILAEVVRGHWEITRGTSAQARDYAKKDGDFTERGNFPDRQGRRTDLERIIEWLDGFIADNGRAPSVREVAVLQPGALLRYRNFMELAALRAPLPVLREGELWPWQNDLVEELNGEADDRKVVFYVDVDGGTGKTFLQQWLLTAMPERVQVLSIGKRDDIAYVIDVSKDIFLFSIPRTQMEYLNYSILEQLKDRMVFSTKYQSTMKILLKTPHVIVFCNENPDATKLSADRYVIRDNY